MSQLAKELRSSQVRVVFTHPVCQKHNYTIPISRSSERDYMTGQDLDHDKKIGLAPLTPEEKKRYPFVINPTSYYKLVHKQILNMDDPHHKALYELTRLYGDLAQSLREYKKDPMRYKGYFEDTVAEAYDFNLEADEAWEAEQAVRNLPQEDYERVAYILNFRLKKNIKPKKMPMEVVRSLLIKSARENPKEVKLCFPQFNPGIEEDIYILELINNNILSKKPNNEIYDEQVYLGVGIEGVKSFMSRPDQSHVINKWQRKLELKRNSGRTTAPEPVHVTKQANEEKNFRTLLDQAKACIVDEDVELCEISYTEIKQKYPHLLSEKDESKIQSFLNDTKAKTIVSAAEKFKNELEGLELVDLHKKINHHMTPFEESEAKDFWEDKESLIEYMVNKKYND